MRWYRFLLFPLVVPLFLLTDSLAAQTGSLPSDKNWKNVCEKAQPIPVVAPTNTHDESWLKTCDSAALYYGFAGAADYAAARECATYQQAHADPTRGDPFAGAGVLTMLYANGDGVARNYDSAIHFACENTWAAPAEQEYRIGHLEELKASNGSVKKFDLCDDVTSGLMMGACEGVQQSLADAKRNRELQAFVAVQHWNAVTQEAFERLQAAEKNFEEARARSEIDLSGTARSMFVLADQGRLRDQFLINLQRFSKGDVPDATATDAQHWREQVKAALAKIDAMPSKTWDFGTIKPEGIHRTQAVWNQLEEAWVAFGQAAFPAMTADRIRTQLDRLRLHQLESLARA